MPESLTHVTMYATSADTQGTTLCVNAAKDPEDLSFERCQEVAAEKAAKALAVARGRGGRGGRGQSRSNVRGGAHNE